MWPGGSRVPNLALSDHASLLWGTSWLPGPGPSIPLSPTAIPCSLVLSEVAACQSSHRVLAKGASWCLHLNRDPSLKSDNEARVAVRANLGPAHSCRPPLHQPPWRHKVTSLTQKADFSTCNIIDSALLPRILPGLPPAPGDRKGSTCRHSLGSCWSPTQECCPLPRGPQAVGTAACFLSSQLCHHCHPPRWASNDLLWASYLPTTMQPELQASLHCIRKWWGGGLSYPTGKWPIMDSNLNLAGSKLYNPSTPPNVPQWLFWKLGHCQNQPRVPGARRTHAVPDRAMCRSQPLEDQAGDKAPF